MGYRNVGASMRIYYLLSGSKVQPVCRGMIMQN